MNFALHKSANQSTTLTYNGFNWTADKAVDGNRDGSVPDMSRTCSATIQIFNVNHTWEVDIGFPIIVQTITVYGRTDAGTVNNLVQLILFLNINSLILQDT
ncbi:hypothetical protein ACJMK2_032214 [Sinanodonta woodiana]|uniref:Uncharacterized protein n=1 Tax=Sinanodonta woodiana TaxID=1069815 RepID=A0ABD3X4M1_SINWO